MRDRIIGAIKDDAPILITGWLCGTLLLALLASKGILGLRPTSILNNTILYALVLLMPLIWRIIRLMIIEKPDELIKVIVDREFNHINLNLFLRITPLLLTLCIFMPIFSTMKSAIPLFNEYTWDSIFIDWDRQIFGTDAWILFYPFLFNPIILSIIAFLYHIWILLIYIGGVFFVIKLDNKILRSRYFISYFLTWTIVGSVMAIYFASVGPCFAQPLLGIDDFEPLMGKLREANNQFPIMVLDVQNQLILWQEHGERGLGRGITAMPSMHVSLALLFFLAVRQTSNLAGWVFGGFFIAICIGSVVTGYHYAVDGIIGAIATLGIWHAVGIALRMNVTVPHSELERA